MHCFNHNHPAKLSHTERKVLLVAQVLTHTRSCRQLWVQEVSDEALNDTTQAQQPHVTDSEVQPSLYKLLTPRLPFQVSARLSVWPDSKC